MTEIVKRKMPRTRRPIPSESESVSESEEYLTESETSEEEQPPKRSKHTTKSKKSKVKKSKGKRREVSESESEVESSGSESEKEEALDDFASIQKKAQQIFNETYKANSKAKKNKGKFPPNVNLYLKQQNKLTKKKLWVVLVRGKNNEASDIALQAAQKWVDDHNFQTSLRVEMVQDSS